MQHMRLPNIYVKMLCECIYILNLSSDSGDDDNNGRASAFASLAQTRLSQPGGSLRGKNSCIMDVVAHITNSATLQSNTKKAAI
jgi:hypothetical protein